MRTVPATLALALALVADALPAQTIAWLNEPGGVAVARDAADNVYTARWDYNPGGDIHVARRDAAGTLIWEERFDNLDGTRHEVATFVAADNGGNVLVSGTVRSGFANPVNAASVLMKFAPDGALLWRRVYGGDFDGSSTRRLVIDPSLFDTPVTRAVWKGIQGDPSAALTDTHGSLYLFPGTTDPDHSGTSYYLAFYRAQLQNRAISLGPPPYAHCP